MTGKCKNNLVPNHSTFIDMLKISLFLNLVTRIIANIAFTVL